MAKADYIRPVEALHGKLKKSDKVGFAKRQKSGTKFTVYREDWSQPLEKIDPSKQAAVRAQRLKFKTVATSAHERMTDPNKRQMDQAAFAAQSKYTTLFGYLFHLEWEDYED